MTTHRTQDEPTPLTDKSRERLWVDLVPASFARQLERMLGRLLAAARHVPIVDRPDPQKGPPFSVCLGCGSSDSNDCLPDCWVRTLELAIDAVEELK